MKPFGGLRAIIYKEFIHVRRDPASLLFIFIIPLFQLTLFGYAIDTEVRHIPTVVCDQDHSPESRALVAAFANTGYFDVVGGVESERAVKEALVGGRATVGVTIPPRFAATLLEGGSAQVQVLVDGSESARATTALNVANGIGFERSIKEFIATGRLSASREQMPVDVRPRLLFNPQLRSANFFVPGLVGVVLQIVTVILTAFAIVRERESGTLEQVLVTPVSKGGLMLGKLLPYSVIGFVQFSLVLAAMVVVFRVPVRGSVGLLYVLSVLFVFAALALGLLISTFARTQGQALQMAIVVIVPSILLSGFVFPRESMPLPIYAVTFLIPVTYYMEVLRGIIIRGADLSTLWDEALLLGAMTAGLVTLSVLRFRRTLS
jgi:ribosome-dependent ATPase